VHAWMNNQGLQIVDLKVRDIKPSKYSWQVQTQLLANHVSSSKRIQYTLVLSVVKARFNLSSMVRSKILLADRNPWHATSKCVHMKHLLFVFPCLLISLCPKHMDHTLSGWPLMPSGYPVANKVLLFYVVPVFKLTNNSLVNEQEEHKCIICLCVMSVFIIYLRYWLQPLFKLNLLHWHDEKI